MSSDHHTHAVECIDKDKHMHIYAKAFLKNRGKGSIPNQRGRLPTFSMKTSNPKFALRTYSSNNRNQIKLKHLGKSKYLVAVLFSYPLGMLSGHTEIRSLLTQLFLPYSTWTLCEIITGFSVMSRQEILAKFQRFRGRCSNSERHFIFNYAWKCS